MKTFEEILFDVELDKEVSQALRTSRRNRKRIREEARKEALLLLLHGMAIFGPCSPADRSNQREPPWHRTRKNE